MLSLWDRMWYGNPWRRLSQLQRDMDRLVGETRSTTGATWAAGFPAVNIWSKEDRAIIKAELPGVKAEDIDVSASGQGLTIRGERSREDVGDGVTWHRRERRMGAFARSVELPFTIAPDSVDASYRDGVLEVHVERVEAEKPRRIEVRT